MPDHDKLRPASRDDLLFALSYGPRGKRRDHASELMAQIAAKVLVEHLELSGFVVRTKPPREMHSTTPHMPPRKGHLTD